MNNKTEFYDKVVLVTGAASGIGKATANLFLARGASVFGVDLKFPVGKTTKISKKSVRFGADLTSDMQVQNMVRSCISAFGNLQIVVNCAGVEMKGTVMDLSESSFHKVMDTNVKSIFLVSKHTIPILLKNSSSSIINLSSDLGLQPIPGVDAYAASKGAIISLTKAMAKNWSKKGLRINCVAPGPIDTPLLHRFQDDKSLSFVKEFMIPTGRLGRPEEIANVIGFLASDDASFISGAVLTVNGGLVG